MSLVGSLKDLPFSDILQILCLSRRSGILYLKSGDPIVILRFRNGLLSGLDLPGEESPLIRGIRREKLVPPEVLEQAIRECRRASDSLIQNLAAKTYLDPDQVFRMVVSEVREVLRRLLTWSDGEFRFEIGGSETAGKERSDEMDPHDGATSLEGTLLRIPEGLDPREILLEEMQVLGAESVHHFFLPTLPPPARAVDASLRSPDPGEVPAKGDSTLCVVLVDERSVYRDLLASVWRKEGFRVDSFTSPEAGYQRFALLAESGAPVSLVSDLVVPETGGSGFAGGLELLIRARQEFPGAKVLLMSEGMDPTVEEAARSLGARAILQKPMTLPADSEGLREAVESLARQGVRLLQDEGADLAEASPDEDQTETIRVVDQLSLLGALLGELRRPGSDMEIPLLVLRLASEYFERGVLLAVGDMEVRGLGGFAGNGEQEFLGRKCRGFSLPIAAGTRLKQVLSDKASVRGPLQHPDEVRLLEQLGGGPASDGVLLPLLSNNHVVAVLYGDNGKSASPVGDTRGLEIFLGEVAIALEKTLKRQQAASAQRN